MHRLARSCQWLSTSVAGIAILVAPFTAATAQEAPLKRVVLDVASTNDEWTSTGLSVQPGDLVIIAATGTIKVGNYTGMVDATGTPPNGATSTGYGVLQHKIGTGAGRSTGRLTVIQPEQQGTLKLRVHDSKYEDNAGAFQLDVLVIPKSAVPPPTPAPASE